MNFARKLMPESEWIKEEKEDKPVVAEQQLSINSALAPENAVVKDELVSD